MRISVIIPAYNVGDVIGVQLGALARERWDDDWEIIVADNGSTDNTRDVVRAFQAEVGNLRLVDASERKGAGHGRNLGAALARGDGLLFCDADDEVAHGWLTAMGRALEQHPFIASRLEGAKLSTPEALRFRGCPQEKGLQEYHLPPFLPHAAGASLGIRRRVHEAVGGFDESFLRLQDTDYCWRVQLKGYPLTFVPDALVHMRFRGSARQSLRQARDWGEYNVRLYARYRRHGMPRLPLLNGVRRWYHLARRAPRALTDETRRERWLWSLHWTLGRLAGCVKYRVLAP